MTMQADMTAGRNLCPSEAQFPTLDGIDLTRKVYRSKLVLANQPVVGRCGLLAEYKACREEHECGERQAGKRRSGRILPPCRSKASDVPQPRRTAPVHHRARGGAPLWLSIL